MPSIYSILNTRARAWWYHRRLRGQGQAAEARRRERASIRERARDLKEAQRNGGFVTIGRGGWTLRIERNHTLQGYGDMTDAIPQCARRLGLPIVDSTTIPDELIARTIVLPMPQIGAPPRPEYGALDYAPLEVVARMYRDLGATVYNLSL